MSGKFIKIKILCGLFKLFKINPMVFAYNKTGILNWQNQKLSGEKYFLEKELLKNLGKDRDCVFFDVGANVGNYSENLLCTFKNATVHAFEPLPLCVQKLKTIQSNFKDRLIVNNLCMSDEIGNITINTYDDDPESEHASIYQDVLTVIHKSKNACGIPVIATTLDSYCEEHKIDRIHFIKIDTEGHEYKVLLGAKRMLQENRISYLQFEFNEMNVISRTFFKDFYDLLSENYSLYRLNTYNLIPINSYDSLLEVFKFQNFIAVNKAQ